MLPYMLGWDQGSNLNQHGMDNTGGPAKGRGSNVDTCGKAVKQDPVYCCTAVRYVKYMEYSRKVYIPCHLKYPMNQQ